MGIYFTASLLAAALASALTGVIVATAGDDNFGILILVVPAVGGLFAASFVSQFTKMDIPQILASAALTNLLGVGMVLLLLEPRSGMESGLGFVVQFGGMMFFGCILTAAQTLAGTLLGACFCGGRQ